MELRSLGQGPNGRGRLPLPHWLVPQSWLLLRRRLKNMDCIPPLGRGIPQPGATGMRDCGEMWPVHPRSWDTALPGGRSNVIVRGVTQLGPWWAASLQVPLQDGSGEGGRGRGQSWGTAGRQPLFPMSRRRH